MAVEFKNNFDYRTIVPYMPTHLSRIWTGMVSATYATTACTTEMLARLTQMEMGLETFVMKT